MTRYVDVNVVIGPGQTPGTYSVRAQSAEGGERTSTMTLPFTLADMSRAVFGVAETSREIADDPDPSTPSSDPRTAREFGIALFDALFEGRSVEVLAATRAVAAMNGQGVRIRLTLDPRGGGMGAVASLPWELMRQEGDEPLVVSVRSPLVRSLDTLRARDPRPFETPLRVLVLMSNPAGSAPLDLAAERRRLDESWAGRPGVAVDYVAATRAALRTALRAHVYHVVHYMGHGDHDAETGGVLLLEDAAGQPDRIDGATFAGLFEDEPLRMVFLNACKSGTMAAGENAHPFAGVAAALVRAGVPAVVAMQFPISDAAAIVFAGEFYAAIADGLPVDAAVGEGRKALKDGKRAEWATPVLYMRASDGTMLATLPAASQAEPAAAGPQVFLATVDQDLESLREKVAAALRADGASVVETPPRDDANSYAAAADAAIRAAELTVHLLGSEPGRRRDSEAPPEPLDTYPLDQLRRALSVARAQLVVMTAAARAAVVHPLYRAELDALDARPRSAARLQVQVIDKQGIVDAVRARVTALRAPPEPVRTAVIDSHEADEASALALFEYLGGRDLDVNLQLSSSAAAVDLLALDDNVARTSLYVIVGGNVDRGWVNSRQLAVTRSATKSRASLVVARYAAPPGSDAGAIDRSRFALSPLRVADLGWLDRVLASAA